MAKFLDEAGVQTLWNKTKSKISSEIAKIDTGGSGSGVIYENFDVDVLGGDEISVMLNTFKMAKFFFCSMGGVSTDSQLIIKSSSKSILLEVDISNTENCILAELDVINTMAILKSDVNGVKKENIVYNGVINSFFVEASCRSSSNINVIGYVLR